MTQPRTPFRHIICYATGEGAGSLVMNAINGFALLYYTKALGLDSKLAGLALAISVLWDAVTDPVMGHLTDNTRSRYGRRHPYILAGGLLMVVCFYFFWAVPNFFAAPKILFWYLVVINLLLRTAITVFAVPFVALGFEVCVDYNDRSRLQGVKSAFGMLANFAGPAMAWTFFFKDDGQTQATTVGGNYVRMATVFSLATVLLIVFLVFSTRKYAVDSRKMEKDSGHGLRGFCKDILEIFTDKNPRTIFIFITIILMGIVVVGSTQMFVYDDFLKLPAQQKTMVHGSSMLGSALGGLLLGWLTRRFDKKPVLYLAVSMSILCSIALAAIFLTGLLPPGVTWTIGPLAVPVSMWVFLVFHALYWMGNGIMMPLSYSMMADVSEVNYRRTGVLKDGGYSAVLSFVYKFAIAIGLYISGYCLDWAGFEEGVDVQTAATTRNLLATMCLVGAIVPCLALLTVKKYPINRQFIEQLRAQVGDEERG